KLILGQWLYRGLGEVKPIPNAAIERKRWLWIFGIALFLFAFQTIVLLGFVSGYFNILRHPEQLNALRKIPLTWQPWLWVATLPWLYLVAVPWCVRGVEEAKTYAVLVGQGVIWIAYAFNREGFNVSEGMKNWLVLMFLGLQVVVLIWAVLTVKRGWREHREYLAILRSLPREEV
ncbi:MAG: hypothetical protein Q8O00_15630, partial [Holophaga sp.]|nr:hypothetical protein [Holophaga sp.]